MSFIYQAGSCKRPRKVVLLGAHSCAPPVTDGAAALPTAPGEGGLRVLVAAPQIVDRKKSAMS